MFENRAQASLSSPPSSQERERERKRGRERERDIEVQIPVDTRERGTNKCWGKLDGIAVN
jgi:hypothetical protein